LNDGRIQNPSNPVGIVPLSNFVPRGFGFIHHSIAILYRAVPNPDLTIRDFFHRRFQGELFERGGAASQKTLWKAKQRGESFRREKELSKKVRVGADPDSGRVEGKQLGCWFCQQEGAGGS
jgi:hypothetical protein